MSQQTRSVQLENQITGERSGQPPADASVMEQLLFTRQLAAYQLARAWIPVDSSVLDVACGTGYGAESLVAHGARVTGVDIDAGTIDRCREDPALKACCFVLADGQELPFADESFDVVVSFQTIEHVDAHERFVAELRRVLVSGGCCVVTTPNRRLRLKPRQRPWNRFHVREYGAIELLSLLQTAFEEVEIHGLTGSPCAMDLERNRLRAARRVAAWDPLRLRHKLPASFCSTLLSRLRRFQTRWNGRQTREPGGGLDKSEFFLTAKPDEALDLFAICR